MPHHTRPRFRHAQPLPVLMKHVRPDNHVAPTVITCCNIHVRRVIHCPGQRAVAAVPVAVMKPDTTHKIMERAPQPVHRSVAAPFQPVVAHLVQRVGGCKHETENYIYRINFDDWRHQRICGMSGNNQNIHCVQSGILFGIGNMFAMPVVGRCVWNNGGQKYRRHNIMLFTVWDNRFRRRGQFYIHVQLLLHQLI